MSAVGGVSKSGIGKSGTDPNKSFAAKPDFVQKRIMAARNAKNHGHDHVKKMLGGKTLKPPHDIEQECREKYFPLGLEFIPPSRFFVKGSVRFQPM